MFRRLWRLDSDLAMFQDVSGFRAMTVLQKLRGAMVCDVFAGGCRACFGQLPQFQENNLKPPGSTNADGTAVPQCSVC